MLEPVFSPFKEPEKTTSKKEPAKHSQTVYKRKLSRRKKDGIPSIKDALSGKIGEESISAKEQHQIYTNSNEKKDFTEADLKEKWLEFLQRLDDRPNLKSTLSVFPVLGEDNQLVLEIENSIQDGLVNNIKPELVSWLRKELKNSGIRLNTKITKKTRGRIIYTDSEKYEEMVKKNPKLALLRKKLGLDFDQ